MMSGNFNVSSKILVQLISWLRKKKKKLKSLDLFYNSSTLPSAFFFQAPSMTFEILKYVVWHEKNNNYS